MKTPVLRDIYYEKFLEKFLTDRFFSVGKELYSRKVLP